MSGSESAVGAVKPLPTVINPNKTNLRRFLAQYFNESELRDICFDLPSVNYEDLPGLGRSDKARELVAYCERHGQLDELVAICFQCRPEIDVANLIFDKVPD